MFIYDAASVRVVLAVLLLLLKPLDSLLQLLHHAPQDHGELLIVESHQFSPVQVLRLAHGRAQGPAGLHVGHEADLVLARSDSVEELRLHGVEGLLQLLVRDGLDVPLEGPVPQVDEAVAENPVAAPDVGFDGR